MVVGIAFSNCKGSFLSSSEALSPMKVKLWNKEPLMGFEMSLKAEPHLYGSVADVYRAHSASSKCHLP
jgi:hypothetical protein